MNSALNPEAPEFYPHLTSFTQGGYATVNKTIRTSNCLPTGCSLQLFKTYTDFNIVTCKLSENVIRNSNKIVMKEFSGVKLKRNDNEYNMETIIDANDNMLDRVNINIDSVSGVNLRSEEFIKSIKPIINVSSWNRTPNSSIIAKIQVGNTTFFGGKNIMRPQLTFKDAIDNSENLWVPKISDKPNNIKPLALNIIFNDEGEAVGYEHPYKVELDLYHPPSEFIEPHSPPSFPASLEDTKLTYVDTEASVEDLVKHLSSVKEMAVDVEHHSYRTYQGITCLIQISTNEGGDFIIDTIAVREHIYKLNVVFTDPKKIKVLHGAEMDILWLQRDFGVYIVGMFDTQQAGKALNLNRLSLKYLLMRYCRVDADKKHQLADWRIRPLPDEMVTYARSDTHYLLYIWRKMKAELLDAGLGQPRLLLAVFEQSRQVCGTTYNKEVIHENSHMPMYVRSKKSFNSQQMSALQLLYKWRDTQARSLDESTMYLLPNHMLLSLSETLPREVQGVNACCQPMPPFVKQNLIVLHKMLLSCRELPLEPQLYQMPSGLRSVINTTHQLPACQVHDFAHFPDFREDQINLDLAESVMESPNPCQPDIEIFMPTPSTSRRGIGSGLNADAQLFIPPFDRYRKYRCLAQIAELREFKEKEAKIAAISKGNAFLKSEVLVKMQHATTQVENEDNSDVLFVPVRKAAESKHKKVKRKRKMSSEKIREKDLATETTEKIYPKSENRDKHVKPYLYKNVNYKKFYDDSDKSHKQPKMKFKKHK